MAAVLVRNSLIEGASDLKNRLEKARSEEDLVTLVENQKYFSFFRISIINEQKMVIYDTYVDKVPYALSEHRDVQEALKEGTGYAITTSKSMGGKFAYVAETFTFQGKTYILRIAFPYKQIEDLTKHFEIGVLIFSFFILLFFNILIWTIFNRLTRPIREIIDAIKPYHMGEKTSLPKITLTKTTGPGDDFQSLAHSLNSLSSKVQEQIESLKEEKNEKEAILESLGEGVIAVDSKMHILYINYIACKMLGITRRAVLSHPLDEQINSEHPRLLLKCKELLSKCQQSGDIVNDSLIFGTERKTYIDLIAVPKADAAGAIIVLQDKSSHYQVLEMGKDFVANASHELRTPITIIKGYAETLRDMPDMEKELYTEIIEKIGRSCERMENLVKNLLILADIENLPESRFIDCDMISLLENCRHTLLSVYPEAEVTIEKSQDELVIQADGGLLELAIINLLDNAAKYSKPPPKIHIRIAPSEEEEILIEIKDQGKGIPTEDLEHIFNRFYRVDKTHSRKLGGAGLGLSIVKTIILKHDGTIKVDSELGRGTTMTIILPIRHHSRL